MHEEEETEGFQDSRVGRTHSVVNSVHRATFATAQRGLRISGEMAWIV